MLILAVNGSPRPAGNTYRLLRASLDVVRLSGADSVLVQVSEAMAGLKVPYCIACSDVCEGKCYAGTKLEETLGLFARADGIIIGSPVYFCTVSAPLKALWDKTRPLRKAKALLNVVGGALSVGGARFGGQETTIRAIHDMMLCQGMTVVGDGYRDNDAGHQGACAHRPADEDLDGLKRAGILAQRVVDVARATRELRRHRTVTVT